MTAQPCPKCKGGSILVSKDGNVIEPCKNCAEDEAWDKKQRDDDRRNARKQER
jgi:uncharacterized Zn finger protein (UPF0148 family)